MRKVLLSLFTLLSILAGTEHIAVASANRAKDVFSVRFRENTLVATAPGMTEANLCTQNGKLIERQQGCFAQFEINQQGNYVLHAIVNGETVSRIVIVK